MKKKWNFWRINYMEKQGSGLTKIIDLYASHPNYLNDLKPVFMSNEHLFKVILWNLNYKKMIFLKVIN
ncbi:hypothetical protein [Mycoplasma putrefaciens]|uniref:hypothetical protein n=2 Tax=Mycoplasma putrefaciens TaxID=2123 RepID=UPI001E43E6AB|nr:hypothetical protein [Mycoplasma putrefaciens]